MDEGHGILRESEGPRVNGVQFRGQLQCRMGEGNVRVPLMPTPSSGTESPSSRQGGNVENPGVEREFWTAEEGVGDDT